MADDNKNISREEKIKRVTEELKNKNKEVIARREREGFGIPEHKKTDAQKRIQSQKQKEKLNIPVNTNKESSFWSKINNWQDSQHKQWHAAADQQRRDSRCPNCKHNVSISAYTCPSCGHPIRFSGTRAGAGCLGWTLIFIAIPAIILALLIF
jgi:hypothetical protein